MENPLERQASPKITNFVSTLALLILLPLLVLGVFNSIQQLLRALGTPADIIVNTDIRLDTIRTDYMSAFAQGGEEAKDMLAPVVNDIKLLRPKLIRLDHIYDSYNVVSRSGNGTLSFDFSRLDEAVTTILQTGALPVFSLSYMPQAIAKDGSIINPPTNWDEWALVVQKTIEHYSGRTNRNLTGVYYEVWNEPDLAQFGSWRLTGEKNYITLYRYASRGAQNSRNVNQFFIGGPSTTGLYKNWIFALVQSGARVDFFSWHSYLKNPRQFAIDKRNIASWLTAYPQYSFLPQLITEFGFTGAKDSRYGTMYSAAYTASVFRHTAVGSPAYLFSFQLKDGPNQSDGWGLIGHETNGKIRKPRYSVYPFIRDMAGTRLELLGEGSWVQGIATVRDNIIRVMLINFNHESNKSENVPVTFNKLAPGNYAYRERFLLGRNVTFNESVTDTSLVKQVFMPANSVAILELEKLSDATPSSAPLQ